jgi:hypothetical protein
MIVIVTWGTNSSGGWDTKLSLLLFDKQRKPMPWQATSHFDVNDRGVEEMIQSPASDSIGVVVPLREGTNTGAFTNIYDLYDIIGDRVQSVTSNRYGVKWPLIPQDRPDIKAHHVIDALSTLGPAANAGLNELPSRVKSLARRESDDNLEFKFENGVAIRAPQIVVEDTAKSGRTIIFEPTEADLRERVKPNLAAQFIGKSCYWKVCTPLIMKVSEP